MAHARTHDTLSPKTGWGAALSSGALAGILAGSVMMLVAMIRGGVTYAGFWLPPKLVAGLWFDTNALLGDGGVIVAGLFTHLAVSAFWGVVFALLVGRQGSTMLGIGVGLLYGIAIWAFMTWLVLPWTNDLMAARTNTIPGWWFAYHLVYGFVVGFTPTLSLALHRSTATRRRAEPVPA